MFCVFKGLMSDSGSTYLCALLVPNLLQTRLTTSISTIKALKSTFDSNANDSNVAQIIIGVLYDSFNSLDSQKDIDELKENATKLFDSISSNNKGSISTLGLTVQKLRKDLDTVTRESAQYLSDYNKVFQQTKFLQNAIDLLTVEKNEANKKADKFYFQFQAEELALKTLSDKYTILVTEVKLIEDKLTNKEQELKAEQMTLNNLRNTLEQERKMRSNMVLNECEVQLNRISGVLKSIDAIEINRPNGAVDASLVGASYRQLAVRKILLNNIHNKTSQLIKGLSVTNAESRHNDFIDFEKELTEIISEIQVDVTTIIRYLGNTKPEILPTQPVPFSPSPIPLPSSPKPSTPKPSTPKSSPPTSDIPGTQPPKNATPYTPKFKPSSLSVNTPDEQKKVLFGNGIEDGGYISELGQIVTDALSVDLRNTNPIAICTELQKQEAIRANDFDIILFKSNEIPDVLLQLKYLIDYLSLYPSKLEFSMLIGGNLQFRLDNDIGPMGNAERRLKTFLVNMSYKRVMAIVNKRATEENNYFVSPLHKDFGKLVTIITTVLNNQISSIAEGIAIARNFDSSTSKPSILYNARKDALTGIFDTIKSGLVNWTKNVEHLESEDISKKDMEIYYCIMYMQRILATLNALLIELIMTVCRDSQASNRLYGDYYLKNETCWVYLSTKIGFLVNGVTDDTAAVLGALKELQYDPTYYNDNITEKTGVGSEKSADLEKPVPRIIGKKTPINFALSTQAQNYVRLDPSPVMLIGLSFERVVLNLAPIIEVVENVLVYFEQMGKLKVELDKRPPLVIKSILGTNIDILTEDDFHL
jgi:hypothetical protein